MNTTDGNKLIAEFMGAVMKRAGFYHSPVVNFPTGWNTCRAEDMKYHDSFDWLMSVVEKIEGLQDKDNHQPLVDVHIVQDSSTIEGLTPDGIFLTGKGKTKLESTYNAVIQFILWYNENKSLS